VSSFCAVALRDGALIAILPVAALGEDSLLAALLSSAVIVEEVMDFLRDDMRRWHFDCGCGGLVV